MSFSNGHGKILTIMCLSVEAHFSIREYEKPNKIKQIEKIEKTSTFKATYAWHRSYACAMTLADRPTKQIAKKVSGFLGVGNIQRIRLKDEELSK